MVIYTIAQHKFCWWPSIFIGVLLNYSHYSCNCSKSYTHTYIKTIKMWFLCTFDRNHHMDALHDCMYSLCVHWDKQNPRATEKSQFFDTSNCAVLWKLLEIGANVFPNGSHSVCDWTLCLNFNGEVCTLPSSSN